MRKILYLFILATLFSSCIDWGLDELPVYDEAEITDFDLEHRYVVKNENGVERMAIVALNLEVTIDSDTKIITVNPTVPPATGDFPEEERNKVSLSNITAYTKISPAAKIQPIDGAPELGKPGDFSTEQKYNVSAADGKTSNIWTIKVNALSSN